jgi:hypothetical protein
MNGLNSGDLKVKIFFICFFGSFACQLIVSLGQTHLSMQDGNVGLRQRDVFQVAYNELTIGEVRNQ